MTGEGNPALQLDLRRHCIETAIRKRYEKALKAYFKSETNRDKLEKEIQLLLQALETLDFPSLRSTYRPLAGASTSQIRLSMDSTGRLTIHVDDQPLPDLPQK